MELTTGLKRCSPSPPAARLLPLPSRTKSPRSSRRLHQRYLTMAQDAGSGESLQEKGLTQRLGQSFNSVGVALFARVALVDRQLAVPHLSVDSLCWVDWAGLAAAGFRGCVFDKDNTLTEPYSLQLRPDAEAALRECRAAFGERLVLYSNSAGLLQFDPDGSEARALEQALRIPVLRHREKKPGGGASELAKHFGCSAEELVMVGDRYLTDIVFGNCNGMLTVRTTPFTSSGEPATVRMARGIEERLVARWTRAGCGPPPHRLASAERLAGFVRHADG